MNFLPLTTAHAILAGQLDLAHRDPFDRLLAAQALSERIAFLSNDAAVETLGVTRVW